MQAYYWSLLIVGVIASLYTFALYIIGNKGWFKSEIGQILLTLSGAVAAFYAWYLFLLIVPSISLEVRAYVRLGLFTITTAAIVFRAVLMTKIRLVARYENSKESQPNT